MPRDFLDRKISDLKDQVLVLESMVRQSILVAVEALMDRDEEASRRIYKYDIFVNEKRFAIEKDCLTTIATQQPIARDLRILSSILEVITELERIGDYAKGIGRINLMLVEPLLPNPMMDLPIMTRLACDMLMRATNAFVQSDIEAARLIPAEDDQVDLYFNRIYHGLVKYVIQNPDSVDQANHLQWAAHNIERMADRVTNICERTIFIATGEMNELEESDNEAKKIHPMMRL